MYRAKLMVQKELLFCSLSLVIESLNLSLLNLPSHSREIWWFNHKIHMVTGKKAEPFSSSTWALSHIPQHLPSHAQPRPQWCFPFVCYEEAITCFFLSSLSSWLYMIRPCRPQSHKMQEFVRMIGWRRIIFVKQVLHHLGLLDEGEIIFHPIGTHIFRKFYHMPGIFTHIFLT